MPDRRFFHLRRRQDSCQREPRDGRNEHKSIDGDAFIFNRDAPSIDDDVPNIAVEAQTIDVEPRNITDDVPNMNDDVPNIAVEAQTIDVEPQSIDDDIPNITAEPRNIAADVNRFKDRQFAAAPGLNFVVIGQNRSGGHEDRRFVHGTVTNYRLPTRRWLCYASRVRWLESLFETFSSEPCPAILNTMSS